MTKIVRIWKNAGAALSASALLFVAAGCHSFHIEATVLNHTGGTITLLEVDYPSASFGVDTLAADGTVHHRIQIRDSGPISVQYTADHGRQVLVKGPTLYEKQEGSVEIDLQPNGKVEFHPSLNPQH
jgi:hypothetical protein